MARRYWPNDRVADTLLRSVKYKIVIIDQSASNFRSERESQRVLRRFQLRYCEVTGAIVNKHGMLLHTGSPGAGNNRFHRRSRVTRFEVAAFPRDRGEPQRYRSTFIAHICRRLPNVSSSPDGSAARW